MFRLPGGAFPPTCVHFEGREAGFGSCSEFSILALEVCLLRAVFRWKFQIISICDDSMDMIRGTNYPASTPWRGRWPCR